MANFTAAINALVAERDRVFLVRVAEDFKLPFEQLSKLYLETAEQAIKVPRKYTKKPKAAVTVVAEGAESAAADSAVPKPAKAPKAKPEKQCCQGTTSKKEPCKFSALKGEVFCKRHLAASLGEGTPKVPKAKKQVTKPAEVVHTHALDAEIHDDCSLCQSHGNPLAEAEQEFELVMPVPTTAAPVSVADRLAALLAEADDSEAEEAGTEDDETGFEEFEEEN